MQPSSTVSNSCGLRTAILVRLYRVWLVYSRLGSSLPRAACEQPSWSVSTPCSLRTAILVHLYPLQLSYSHVGPSTPCSLRIAILVGLYYVQLAISHTHTEQVSEHRTSERHHVIKTNPATCLKAMCLKVFIRATPVSARNHQCQASQAMFQLA